MDSSDTTKEAGELAEWFDPLAGQRPSFAEFIDNSASTVVIRDQQLKERGMQARAQLRSVPLLLTFGFDTVLHTDVWDNKFKLVEYDHVDTGSEPDVDFPVVHLVTQEGIDEYGEEQLVRRLVEQSVDENGQYILVTDTVAPKTPTFTKKPGKSVVDEFGSIVVKDYDHLSRTFIEEHLDSRLPMVDTRNVFFHAASTIHQRQDAPAASIAELFDFTAAPSNSPVWESPRYFIRHDLENVLQDYAERLREALRSWTERGDTGKAANQILDVLQICDYELEQLEEYRNRPPAHR